MSSRMIAAMPGMTLTQKIDRYPNDCTSSPPMRGPMARPTLPNTDHQPRSVARLGPVNTFVTIDIVDGEIIAAPMAWKARIAMSISSFTAVLQSIDPTVKMTMPMRRIRRRPNRSASIPAMTTMLAITRM